MRHAAPSDRAGFVLSLLLLALAWPERERWPEACSDPVISAPGEVVCAFGSETTPRLEGPWRRLFGQRLDPNRADAATLETLPGVGPARASAIVRERCKRPFTSLADMRRVPGIGPQRIRTLEPFLEFEEGLAPGGPPPVKSDTCRSICEDGEKPAQASPGCSLPRSREASN